MTLENNSSDLGSKTIVHYKVDMAKPSGSGAKTI